jgi:hypothetical protein
MLRSLYANGKEQYPTISYEVSVSHDGHIMSVTPGHPGTRNDKTAVKFDKFVMDVRNGMYKHVTFQLYDTDGSCKMESNCWLMVDGGYHKWRVLMCPVEDTSVGEELEWSEALESTCKDVECVFGQLKG